MRLVEVELHWRCACAHEFWCLIVFDRFRLFSYCLVVSLPILSRGNWPGKGNEWVMSMRMDVCARV